MENVPHARLVSYAIFHDADLSNFLLRLRPPNSLLYSSYGIQK